MLRVYSIEVAAREKDDLKEEPIISRLRKVSDAFRVPRTYAPFLTHRRPVARAMMGFNNVPLMVYLAQCCTVVPFKSPLAPKLASHQWQLS